MDDFEAKKVKNTNNFIDLEQELKFELAFYEAVAKTDNFDIIPIPDLDGRRLSDEEKQIIVEQARKVKAKILYRIKLGSVAVIFDATTGKTGVVPEDSDLGFYC